MTRGLSSALAGVAAWCCAASPAIAGGPAAPAITAIYPSGGEVPANHLKFYIHFSEPMRQGVFLEHCTLLDARSQPVPDPFREAELWSADRTRLTLWFHPGRQKTGVNLNEEFGPILRPDAGYTLRISGKWPSAGGIPLARDVEKKFHAIARTGRQLDVAEWRLAPGTIGTRIPLAVRFPAPLDRALLLRCVRVADSGGHPLKGTVATAEHEQEWRFTPDAPWAGAPHRLLAESILEDLAGNSLARPFEVDLQAPAPKPVPAIVEIPFHPAPPGG